MYWGEARKGMFVFFTLEQPSADPPIRIARGQIDEIIWPGTTNEYFQLKLVSPGEYSILKRSPAHCYTTSVEALNAARVSIHEQIAELRKKLSCLGDHSHNVGERL